ncbi:hypothetical protein [Lysinibacillus xylanilyticus]|uniref:hypothetical protein n=1 Tax=Lysinibacillus xylanilyticus TaxID=582475 RepID=UPI003D054FEA
MIRITMLDGETIDVQRNTILVGINNYPRDASDQEFYLEQKYLGNLDSDFEPKGSALSTVDERLGIGGFLLSHQAFSIGDGEDKTIYFTSAVKSISVI